MRDRIILAVLAPTTLAFIAAVIVFAVWAGQFSASPTVVNATDILWYGDLYRRVSESSVITEPTTKAVSSAVASRLDFEGRLNRRVMVKPGFRFWVSPGREFGNLHEYTIAKDGSISDSQGVVLSGILGSADYADPSAGLVDVLGPDGEPWFRSRIWKIPDWEIPWIFLEPVPEYSIWFPK